MLTALLGLFDTLYIGYLRIRTVIAFALCLYLLLCCFFLARKLVQTVNWMLILFYASLASFTMLCWGLNAALGIFAMSFVIILAGVLFGSRLILRISVGSIVLLVVIQTVHAYTAFKPDLSPIQGSSTYFDVISYGAILGIFALVTWLNNRQLETSVRRAKNAEHTVRLQKDSLAKQLEAESLRLRQAQQDELQQLYKFATVGQSVTATLHELSNYISVLSLDMDDLKHEHTNSKAIKSANESIVQMSTMIKQIRKRIGTYNTSKIFLVGPVVKKVIKDITTHFHIDPHSMEFHIHSSLSRTRVHGDPFALTQILTILLTNAVEACTKLPNPKVSINITPYKTELHIFVQDNGIGIPEPKIRELFRPSTSTKPSGLGIGLYIAKRITQTHFKGKLLLVDSSPRGTTFQLTIPLHP